jgi:putative iron-regulated protein
MKTKLWLGVGSAVLAGATTIIPPTQNTVAPAIFGSSIAFAEEAGGEGGATVNGSAGGEGGGSAPSSYMLSSTNPDAFKFDATAQIDAYIDLARTQYTAAGDAAQTLEHAVQAMLDKPDEATLAAARAAWVKARPSYLVTEAFRFSDTPIENLEGQINAWPMNEAAIDYVKDNPKAGIINAGTEPLTIEDIVKANGADDEANVTTGWHAVEFLLWGQDFNPDGPGARPATDYVAGTPANDRRRLYLHLVAEELEQDIKAVAKAWADDSATGYVAKLKALPQREVLGRMLNGMAIMAGSELMSARMAVGLDSGDQEDEHSCFSDTTHQDFVYDVQGINNVWTGDSNGTSRAGLDELVTSIDPSTAENVNALFADTTAKIAALGDPWDKVLASPEGSSERQAGEAAVASLQALTDGLTKAGAKLGVLVLLPSGE